MRGPEARLVQDPLTRYLRENKIFYKKKDAGPRSTSAGWPDLEIYPDGGVMFFMECKAPGESLSPIQEHIVNQLRALGYKVYVADSAAYGKIIINQHCNLEGS